MADAAIASTRAIRPGRRAPTQSSRGHDRIAWGLLIYAIMMVTQQQAGTAFVALYVAVIGLFFVANRGLLMVALPRAWPISALTVLAVASTAWSEHQVQTLRLSLELAFTFCFASLVVYRIPGNRIVSAAMIAMSLIAVVSIASNRRETFYDGTVLVGVTGSKNQLAFSGQLLLLSSLAVLFNREQPSLLRLASPVCAALGLLILAVTFSAGALVGAVLAVGMFCAVAFSSHLSKAARVFLLLFLLLLVLLSTAMVGELQAAGAEFLTKVLKKDPSLTGRAFLWIQAGHASHAHPLLGYGYRAFWVAGNPAADGIWTAMKVVGRHGFNFHNTFIENQVELGHLGVAALVLTYLVVTVCLIWLIIERPSALIGYYTAFAFAIIVRSPTESVFPDPLGIYTLLFFITGAFALKTLREVRDQNRQIAAAAHRSRLARVRRTHVQSPVAEGGQWR